MVKVPTFILRQRYIIIWEIFMGLGWVVLVNDILLVSHIVLESLFLLFLVAFLGVFIYFGEVLLLIIFPLLLIFSFPDLLFLPILLTCFCFGLAGVRSYLLIKTRKSIGMRKSLLTAYAKSISPPHLGARRHMIICSKCTMSFLVNGDSRVCPNCLTPFQETE